MILQIPKWLFFIHYLNGQKILYHVLMQHRDKHESKAELIVGKLLFVPLLMMNNNCFFVNL